MADTSQAGAGRPDPRRISLTLWAAIAVFILGALGGIPLGIHDAGSQSILTAAHELPAFHVVSASDVSLRQVPRSAVPPGAVRSLDGVRGHYLLKSLNGGAIVVQDAVGPPAVAADTVVVPLPVSNDNSAWIHTGALVDVLLAPAGQGGRALVIPRAEVVDDTTPASGGHLIFLAIPRDREADIAQVVGRAQEFLVAPTSRP
jgi:hypothetical protein